MKATRDAFGEQLAESALIDPTILAVNADLGKATKLSLFEEEFPSRFIECGIAENNMIGISSGLSEHGYKVFLASFASFLTGKYDTIRCSISYSNAPVIIVGSHGGLAIGMDGVTQMGLEDLSLMRSLPGMTVLNPATPNETKEVVKWLCENDLTGPVYLRIGRQPVPEDISDAQLENYNPFKILKIINQRSENLVLTTGCILSEVLKATKGLNVDVYNVTSIKPLNEGDIQWLGYSRVITVEDHSIIGGLGTAVAEILAERSSNPKLTRIGVQDVFPESAPPADLYEKYGLSADKIRAKIQEVIR